MATTNIGKQRAIGIGKETTAGTQVAASAWIPVESASVAPDVTNIQNKSGFGTINAVSESKTTKVTSNVQLDGVIYDDTFGYVLQSAYGQSTLTAKMTMSAVTGTFVVGEVVTGGTSSATGTITHLTSTVLYVETTSGTFSTGEVLTGGTSAATGTCAFDSAVAAHVFTLDQGTCHQTYSIHKVDDVASEVATYCMLDSLDINVGSEDFARYTANFMGRDTSTSTETASYADENTFTGCNGSVYFADTTTLLDTATAAELTRIKATYGKNLYVDVPMGQCSNSNFYNQVFDETGDLDALFTSETFKDYVLDSSKKSMRIELVDTATTIGTAENPALTIQYARVGFTSWSENVSSDAIISQTMGFIPEYDTDEGYSSVAILLNTNLTGY